MVKKFKTKMVVGFLMLLGGIALLIIVPLIMNYAAPLVTDGQGSATWWRTIWYVGLFLGYGAYMLIFAGVILILLNFLRELKTRRSR
ncbi:MAG: hypothetical protein CVU96_03040 [Firmicutes bacterium HGW-Firmicutes-20]|jgi:hypothetical protein|nr:MAG: hypothetical protein CVU96_03040 [Firmicutes bacterium HGW-Firmicutes-20]PKM65227.1 MAG: hypothetical protein CVU94_08805 [Firmicutes bacterium HGW-Firmicutes-19]